jgi:hypothetical protein
MARATVGDFTIWFDEPDAPAPTGAVASTRPSIRVGVRPPEDGLAVSVEYRGGDRIRQRRALGLTSDHAEIAYFEGAFPDLRVGEEVEYSVLVRCGGRRFLPESRVGELMQFRICSADDVPRIVASQEASFAMPGSTERSVPSADFGTEATSPALSPDTSHVSEEPMTTRPANRYVVAGSGVEATIELSTLSGEPSISVLIDGTLLRNQAFSRSEHGIEVSGLLELVPDSHTIYVRLILPSVNVGAEAVPFAGLLLFTTALTPLVPKLVEGAMHRYQTRPVGGIADAVQP